MPLTTRNSNEKKQVNRNRKTKSAAPKKKASKPKPTPSEIHPVKLAAERLRISHKILCRVFITILANDPGVSLEAGMDASPHTSRPTLG